MISIRYIALIAIAYLCTLFLIAYLGDLERFRKRFFINPNVVYALSLAVYCSSWTFYGGVGTAAVEGLDYLAIYLGPFLVFVAGYPVVRRIILICKQNNITSISDFISSRYGKSRRIGVLVTVIAVFGCLPYIALQLKAVSASYTVLQGYSRENVNSSAALIPADTVAFYTGIILIVFAILFGTRHLDSTEHHRGMVLAIAFESIIKLIAILVVGYYAVYLLLDTGQHENFTRFVSSGSLAATFDSSSSTWISFITKTVLSMSAIVLLPRQFQVMVVESLDHRQFKTAAWVMPIYLMLTSIIVIPIALAGSVLLPGAEEDLYVLTLSLQAGNEIISIIAFVGGLSAATGMAIVSVISLSTMVCNDLVMPQLIRSKSLNILNSDKLNSLILLIRRMAIIVMIAGAYGYYKFIDTNEQLANIGILSFSAIFQFVPAFICSLFWRRSHSRGIFWGLMGGTLVWVYTLMIPTILGPETTKQFFIESVWLHPQSLFGFGMDNSLTHGVIWSVIVNVLLIVFFSFKEDQSTLEKLQASRFFHIGENRFSKTSFETECIGGEENSSALSYNKLNKIPVHPDTLRILAEKIIGTVNTHKVFSEYEQRTGLSLALENDVDRALLSRVQTAIVGVIGASSAQKVISDTLLGGEEYLGEGVSIVDEASTVLQFNRNLLFATLQNITQGISVVDADLNLVIWNDRYLSLFNYPENLIYVGKPIKEVLEYNARRGDFQNKNSEEEVLKRLSRLSRRKSYEGIRTRSNGRVIKSIGEPMPGGGFVTTYEDITQTVNASEALRKANEKLEDRVKERTKELEVLTQELKRATRSKTHFLAAASHDLLQPINAAKLFSHSVLERCDQPEDVVKFSRRVGQSLETANELLRALLDISKLDAGGKKPNLTEFLLKDFIEGVFRDFELSASIKKLDFSVATLPNVWLKTDRELLLSVMQNLVSNAIRYTETGGRVVIEVVVAEKIPVASESSKSSLFPSTQTPQVTTRSQKSRCSEEVAVISVIDSGVGIAKKDLEKVFKEFFQVNPNNQMIKDDFAASKGLGLGLSIVERISSLLGLNVTVDSHLEKGTNFSVDVPTVERSFEPERESNELSFAPIGQRLKGVTVLCVDNEDSVLEAMHTLLEGWGCMTISVSSYREALKELTEKSFQIVLVDYRLDFEETGLDLLSVIRESDGAESTKGVLITAEQDLSLKDKALELDFQYLQKPIEPAALKSLMSYLISS